MRTPKSDWTDLFLAFRMLLDPRKLWLAFKGVAFSVILIGVLVMLFACINNIMGTEYNINYNSNWKTSNGSMCNFNKYVSGDNRWTIKCFSINWNNNLQIYKRTHNR